MTVLPAPGASTRPRRSPAGARTRAVAAALCKRLPFTILIAVAVLLVGLATGALWSSAVDRAWFPEVAYGLPTLTAGRWWTVVTGAIFAFRPGFYLPMTGGFMLLVGFAEWRLGTRRAAVVTVGGQLVGVLGAIAFLLAVHDTGWRWAAAVAGQLDVGLSGGALAALAVVSAVVRPPWRVRVRAALCLYVAVAFLCVGTLADLVHLVVVVVGLPVGGRLTRGSAPEVAGKPGRREWRLAAVMGLVSIAAASTVVWLLPGDGPLGSTASADQSWTDVVVTVVVVGLLVHGLRRGRRSAWRCAVGIGTLNVASGLLVLVLLAVAVDGPVTFENVPLFVAGRLAWAGLLVVLIAGRRAFRVPARRRLRSGLPNSIDQRTATELLQRNGGSTLSWMTTWPGNSHFRTRDGSSSVAYQRHAGVMIAVGDPVGPAATRTAAVAEFARMAERAGAVPALFSVTPPTVHAAASLGWQHVQVAEDTIVDLPELQFRGRSWQDVRSALNRAAKENISFRLVTLADESPALVEQVRAVSREWTGDKGLPEMGFTLGGIDEALDPHVRVGLAQDPDGTIHGVTSWLPVYGAQGQIRGWTLDVMRRRHSGFRPVVEFLIASSCLAFAAEGAAFVSLSGAPLARTADADGLPVLQRLLDNLGAKIEPVYGFRSLHAFKTKFHPRYAPLYLAYRDEADLPRIGIALTRAYLPHTPVRELVKLTRRAGEAHLDRMVHPGSRTAPAPAARSARTTTSSPVSAPVSRTRWSQNAASGSPAAARTRSSSCAVSWSSGSWRRSTSPSV